MSLRLSSFACLEDFLARALAIHTACVVPPAANLHPATTDVMKRVQTPLFVLRNVRLDWPNLAEAVSSSLGELVDALEHTMSRTDLPKWYYDQLPEGLYDRIRSLVPGLPVYPTHKLGFLPRERVIEILAEFLLEELENNESEIMDWLAQGDEPVDILLERIKSAAAPR